MDIRAASLGTGRFHIDSGEFIFPDATYAVVPGNAVVEPRSFEDAWKDGGRPLNVYLGLRRFNRMGPNVTERRKEPPSAGLNTRFVADEAPVECVDLHLDGPPAQVTRMTYVLKILWETEKDFFGEYETIPVARLERRGEEVVVSEDFIPPSVTCEASQALVRMIRDIRDLIASRGFQLEGYKRDRGVHTAEFGSRDMVYLLALRSLNRFIPRLSHLLETPTHPWVVYGVLRELVGELSTFSERCSVVGELDGGQALPGYDHLDLAGCFGRAGVLAAALLDAITAGPDYVFGLAYDGTYFSSELPPEVFEGRNRFFLMVQTEADAAKVVRALITGAKLGSRQGLPLLIARALPGAGLTYLDRPPQELPRKSGALYFQVDHHSDQWASVAAAKNVALFWDAAPEDLKVELMVVRRG